MSHGCDSEDFETILGKLHCEGKGIEKPVLFLLENPGADYGNGAPVKFGDYIKQPPINRYYWSPNIEKWPESIDDFINNWNYYGPYFAYLMFRHQLQDVYITNLVKCKWIKDTGGRKGDGDESLIVRRCIGHHFDREIQIFDPSLIVCFGDKVLEYYQEYSRTQHNGMAVKVIHPAYIKRRSQTSGFSKRQLIEDNDFRIDRALKFIA